MKTNKYTSFNSIHIFCITFLLLLVMTILLFQIKDTYHISLLMLTAALLWIGIMPLRNWTSIDLCLSLITFYDFISCFYANCPIPAIQAAFSSLFCLIVYFILRRLLTNKLAVRILRVGSYLPISAALILAICSFFVFRQSVLNVGFADTYYFRFLFRPLGYITNVWAEILLILLGWSCFLRRYSIVFIFLSVLAILLSFSRGAYIALTVYLFCGLLWIKPTQQKLNLLAVSCIAIALTSLFFPKEMKITLQMNRTLSQQQSTESRINSTLAGWEAFKKYPLLGYGSRNYIYAVDLDLNQDSTRSYTSCAPNLGIQLLLEKGILGTLLYLLLAIAIFRFIWKRREQPESRIIACTLFALVIKDMTQATLLHTPFIIFMIFILLAFLQREEIQDKLDKNIIRYIIPYMVLISYIIYHTPAIRTFIEPTPKLVNEALKNIELYKTSEIPEHLHNAQMVLTEASKRHPEDVQILYLQARVLLYKRKISESETILKELVTRYPKNSLYLVALSEVEYKNGKKEVALESFIKAIGYTPRLLTGECIRQWQEGDSSFYKRVRQKLSELKPSKGADPTTYARYGYIAHWCGNSLANQYLQKAVNELPNLATPWYILGDNEKYCLLTFGAFRTKRDSLKLSEERNLTDSQLFNKVYSYKFRNWYGSELNVSP